MQKVLFFSVKGEAAAPYEVKFELKGANLSASCTCELGRANQYCHHRVSLLEGDTASIVSGDRSQIVMLRDWLKGSDIEAAMAELAKAKSELSIAEEKVAYCRQKLINRMAD
jgi:hypothetical protein